MPELSRSIAVPRRSSAGPAKPKKYSQVKQTPEGVTALRELLDPVVMALLEDRRITFAQAHRLAEKHAHDPERQKERARKLVQGAIHINQI